MSGAYGLRGLYGKRTRPNDFFKRGKARERERERKRERERERERDVLGGVAYAAGGGGGGAFRMVQGMALSCELVMPCLRNLVKCYALDHFQCCDDNPTRRE